jgi:nucleotide-binding universal stress UspA family protein
MAEADIDRRVIPAALQSRLLDAVVGPSVLVVGFDGTPRSGYALVYAAGLADRTGAHLVVVRADKACQPGTYSELQRIQAVTEREVRAIIGAVTCTFDIAVTGGDPAIAIENMAGNVHADLLVVGRSRNRLRHPFASVPSRLVRRSDRPVLVVP